MKPKTTPFPLQFQTKSSSPLLMEDKKANIISISIISALITLIITTRIFLKLCKTFFLILGSGIGLILATLIFLLIRRQYNNRRRLLELKMVSEGRELRIEYSFLRKVAGVPIKFRYKEIEEATNRFGTFLGRGASATVFKGILTDGTSVAVKKISCEAERGEKEFRAEVAAIASVQHVNLVRLLGYCVVPGGPRFLVYDFIPNGSLDCWIFPKRAVLVRNGNRPDRCLSWDLRYRVAVDVARAISYLHQDCRSKVLHLDLKPENILLDENHRAVVADFGLSKLMGKDESRIVTTIRGTKGYLAPEWLLENGISEKSDVYSYGMVLMEMIGGGRNVTLIGEGSERKWRYFPKILREKLGQGKLMEAVDRRVLDSGGVDEREVSRLAFVALWCVQERAELRPSMARVVEMLEGRVQVDEPPETEMIVVDLLAIEDDEEKAKNGPPRIAAVAAELGSGSSSSGSCSGTFSMSVMSGR